MTRTRILIGTLALALSLPVSAAPSFATDDDGSTEGTPEPSSITIDSSQLEDALEPAVEVPDDSSEALAVDEYIQAAAKTGTHLTEADVEVGTVAEGDFAVSTIQLAGEDSVKAIHVENDGDGEVTASIEGTDETAPQAGPGMGYWPSWDDSLSASVKLVVYMKYDGEADEYFKMGYATFQTGRRKFQNDDTTAKDTWQVARRGVAVVTCGRCTASRMWMSQKLKPESQDNAREWSWGNTKPQMDQEWCRDDVSFNLFGFASFTPKNCEEYKIWTGVIGHQRMDFDQGTYSTDGQRAAGYVTGFTLRNGSPAPAFTWYEFVTFRDGNLTSDSGKKCTSEERGAANNTSTYQCYFPGSGDATKEAS